MNRPLRGISLRYAALITLILLWLTYSIAQAADESLAKTIDGYLADPAMAHGIQGVIVQSAADGRVLYERNSDLVFVPASNFKILVSAASLDLLGPDYKMHTSLYMSGKVTPGGTLDGDLILVGGGDPVFRQAHLAEMVEKVKAMGIKYILGNVVGDDTRYDEQRLGNGWSWDYEPYYYAAQVSALNVDENIAGVMVRPGSKEGAPAVVEMASAGRYFIIRNTCVTGKAGSEKAISVDRMRGQNIIRISGTVPLDYQPTGAEAAVTMEEPTLYACQIFIDMLKKEGILLRGRPVRGKKPDDAALIMTHDSPPMSEMIRLLNKPSDNLIAECLLRNLGAELKGKGSIDAGAEAEKEWLGKIGGDVTAVSINDGSGLSRLDYISPKNLAAILSYMLKQKNGKMYFDSLPIAGVDGTIKSRMKGTPAENNCHAKTGYIGRVRTLSGLVTSKSGEQLIFSIMMNGHLCPSKDADAIQDKIVVTLANL